MSRITFATLAVLAPLSTSIARADDLATHEFATLDRAAGRTGIAADLSFVTGDLGDANGAVSRLDLHGQYTHPNGLGVYGSFALSRSFLSADDPFAQMLLDELGEPTARSNLELGVQYRRRLGELALVAHAGLVLPTAQDDDFGALLTNALSIQRRFTDVTTIIPGATTLRFGVSPAWSRGALFARADLGGDIVVDTPEGMMDEVDPIVHANVAVGARTGKLSGSAELVTVATTGDIDEDSDRFLHTAGLSVRYDAGRVAPNLTIVTPLDEGLGDIITVGAGIAATF